MSRYVTYNRNFAVKKKKDDRPNTDSQGRFFMYKPLKLDHEGCYPYYETFEPEVAQKIMNDGMVFIGKTDDRKKDLYTMKDAVYGYGSKKGQPYTLPEDLSDHASATLIMNHYDPDVDPLQVYAFNDKHMFGYSNDDLRYINQKSAYEGSDGRFQTAPIERDASLGLVHDKGRGRKYALLKVGAALAGAGAAGTSLYDIAVNDSLNSLPWTVPVVLGSIAASPVLDNIYTARGKQKYLAEKERRMNDDTAYLY